jgi:hypothetical protein
VAIWQYHRGEWTTIEEELFQEDVYDSLEKMGYGSRTTLGVDQAYGLSAEVWEAKAVNAKWQFFMFVQVTTDNMAPVFVTDFPSMMMLLKELQPIVSHGLLQDFQSVLSMIIDKAFHAWHGHGWEEACMDCDPVEIKGRMRRARRDKSNG